MSKPVLTLMAVAVMLPGAAIAQSNAEAPSQLEPIFVEGDKEDQKPAWVSTTTRQQLDDNQVQDWDDLSRRGEPGIEYNRQTDSVNIRGLDSDRVLTTVDGIRLPWLQDVRGDGGVVGGLGAVDFNSLSSLNIVRGGDGTLGGSGSLAGVVQLRTLEPQDLLRDGKTFGALGKVDYDSADGGRGLNAALAGQIKSDTFWLLQAGIRKGHQLGNAGDVGGYGATRSEPDPAEYDQKSLLFKLQQRFSGGHRLGLTGEYFKRETHVDSLSDQGGSYQIGANSLVKDTERKRISMDYSYKAPDASGLLDSAKATVYWQRLRLTNDQQALRIPDSRASIIPRDSFMYGYPSGAYRRDDMMQMTTYGINTEFSKLIKGAVTNNLTAGGEWMGSRIEQYMGGFDNCPVVPARLPAIFGPRTCDFLHANQADMPNATGSQWALWMQDEIGFYEGRFTLTPALRYDHYRQSPQTGGGYASNPSAAYTALGDNSGGKLSPKLLANFKAADKVNLYAQYAYGFKAPNALQLYSNYGSPDTYLSVGNPNLKPETSQGVELGAKLGDDKLGGSISVFDTHYHNFIDNVALNSSSPLWQPSWTGAYPYGVTGYVNRAKVRIRGVELGAHWAFAPGWLAWSTFTATDGRDQQTHQYLNSVAPLKGMIGLGYGNDTWGADARFTAVMSRNKVENPGSDFKAPGYSLVDLTAWYAPVKGMKLQAGVFNLFDRKYWNALNVPDVAAGSALTRPVDLYTNPRRSFRLSLTYQY